MKISSVVAALAGLALFAGSAQANWVCSVSNDKSQQFTFSAPQEEDAEQMATSVCEANGIKKQYCDADCYDTGAASSRWHCAVVNNKRESWSFTMPSKDQATKLAKLACKSHDINDAACKPSCNIE